MLGKLLKYDLKWIYKVVVFFYALSFIFAILSRIFRLIDNSILFSVIGDICTGVMISMLISSLINGMMRSWARFVNNIYKDESYLTHTLPVNKSDIYLSKVLSAIICAFVTVVVAVICIFICYYSKENLEFLKQTLELAANTYDTTVIAIILVLSFVLFLEIVFIILIGYVGIILGHQTNKNKMVMSIIIAISLYMVTSFISLALIFVVGFFNGDIMNIINTTQIPSIDVIKMLMLFAVIMYLLYNIIYYIIGRCQLKKGVNVD